MRPTLLAACVLGLAATVSAQSAEPRPFLSAEPSFRAMNRETTGVGTTVGLDLTVGTRSWRGLQPIFQGGRLIDVTPADLIRRSFSQADFARQTSTWYGAAGVRYLPPRLWWFQPYAEVTSGAAHMNSEVDSSAGLFHVRRVAPVTNLGAGAELHLGQHFTIDAGYRKQAFFGSADVERRGPRLGFGVRF
jgi:opacity protein-like surface antigen